MSDKKIKYLLIDTSYLHAVSFKDPDFRKLLQHSQENVLKIFIPHIAWEERRTQFLEKVFAKMGKVNDAFEKLNADLSGDFVLYGLPPPTLNIWTKVDVNARSKEVMAAFALENKITIIPIALDHADRAWRRYFDIDLPFNQDEQRENRRKDIPDSWILEAAIDLEKKHPGLLALCGDDRLSDALEKINIRVYKKTQEVLDEIEESPGSKPATKTATIPDAALVSGKATQAVTENTLEVLLAEARGQFKELDTKILGYVGYLETPSKDQLFDLLSRSGVSVEIARNAAERLAIAGVITDTGNHYLPGNKEAAGLAATSIEPEIIKLLEEI